MTTHRHRLSVRQVALIVDVLQQQIDWRDTPARSEVLDLVDRLKTPRVGRPRKRSDQVADADEVHQLAPPYAYRATPSGDVARLLNPLR